MCSVEKGVSFRDELLGRLRPMDHLSGEIDIEAIGVGQLVIVTPRLRSFGMKVSNKNTAITVSRAQCGDLAVWIMSDDFDWHWSHLWRSRHHEVGSAFPIKMALGP